MRMSLTLTLLSVLGFSLTHGEVNIHFHLGEAEDHGTDYSADDEGGTATGLNKITWSTAQDKYWEDGPCPNMANLKLNLADCLKRCDSTPKCTAINFEADSLGCTLRQCPLPVPAPTGDGSQWNIKGYYKMRWGSKNDSCATVNNARCVFPFKFRDQEFVGCTEVGSVDGQPWCSTRTNKEGEHMGGAGSWGQCSSNCPQDQSITLWAEKEPCTINWSNREYRSSGNYRKEWIFEDGKMNGITGCENTKGNKATGFTINKAEKGTFIYFSDYPIDTDVWWLGIINLNGYKDLLTIEVKKTITQPRKYTFKEFEEADKSFLSSVILRKSDGWVKGTYKEQSFYCITDCGLIGQMSYVMVTDRKIKCYDTRDPPCGMAG